MYCVLFGALQRAVRVDNVNVAKRAKPRDARSERSQPVSDTYVSVLGQVLT